MKFGKDIEPGWLSGVVASIGREKKHIMPLLHAIHDRYNYLPSEELENLSRIAGISPMTIAGVSSFYSQFRLKPAGEHFIKICTGTACYVKGAPALYDDIKKHLGIPDDMDTDRDGLFTVMKVACLGCCMLAPAVQIDDITYGPVSSGDIPHILRDFLEMPGHVPMEPEDGSKKKIRAGSIRMCTCSSCSAAGAEAVFSALGGIIASERLSAELKNVACTCESSLAPLIEIDTPDGKTFRYGKVAAEDAGRIVLKHFRPALFLSRLRRQAYSLIGSIAGEEELKPVIRFMPGVRNGGFEAAGGRQKRIATELAGEISPLDIDEYMGSGGFGSLNKCLAADDKGAVIDIIKESGLRGRGGAGYETWRKWSEVKNSPAENKFIICNGDEGDPGAFMDRMILESFPYRVIEGMAIAALTCGIKKGIIYIRSEYPLAVERINGALRSCRERGILASGPKGGGPGPDIEVFVSAGAYVCGEETALIASVEGKRGNPEFRPPYPSQKGLWGMPTLVNNVETFALVPWIIKNGAGAFSGTGTPKSRGTKTFALAGRVKKGGLLEVEMGMTVKDIVFGIGGGLLENNGLKAVQIGGPSGGCLPASLIDTRVDYEELKGAVSIMGSGGMIVLDEEDCMVDMARYFMSFNQNESCGKCTFCRIGTKRMLEILESITLGRGNREALSKLKELAGLVKMNSLCGLGQSAPNPVLTAIKYFEDEFNAHFEGRCPAKKCKALFSYRITDKCIGCTRCAQRCPSDAIEMRPYQRHWIDGEKCTKCDICRLNCPEAAIIREDSGDAKN